MDINLLKIFIHVSNTSSISKAAKELNFTQSNITLRIKQLEKELDCKLFHRVPKGVILTQEGKKLYPNAKEILNKYENTLLKLKNINYYESISIGSTHSNASTRLSNFVIDFHTKFPKTKIYINMYATPFVLENVLNAKLDMAFLSGNPKHQNISILHSFDEQMYIIKPKNIKFKNCILGFHEFCEYFTYFKNYQQKIKNFDYEVMILQNYEMILSCVKVGMGFSLLPLSIIKKFNYENEIKLEKLHDKQCNLSTYLICLKNNKTSMSRYLKKLDIKI